MLRSLPLSFAAALFLCVAAVAQTPHTHAHIERRAPGAWAEGFAMALVDAETREQLFEARDLIVAAGGRVAVVSPPRAIFGWIPPEVAARVVGQKKIRAVHHRPLTAAGAEFSDGPTRVAISAFNEVTSGRFAARQLQESRRVAGASTAQPPMVNCAEPRPPINRNDFIRNLRLMGAEQSLRAFESSVSPQFFGGSDVMDGNVAVAVFLVESNGGIDPNIYSWSAADQAHAFAQTLQGLTWWVDQSIAFQLGRPLQFTVVFFDAAHPACQVPYEPIFRNGADANQWVAHIMSNLGSTAGDVFVRVASFNRKIRDENRANWAFSIFINYNPPPANTSHPDGRASWAYIGGPHTNVLFRSFGWELSRIISHETGHIFYACDEYSQPGYQTCSCTCAPEVRPQAVNLNCEESSCTLNSTACMMRLNEFALCPYTVAQIGWTGTVPKPVPTSPINLVAHAASPTQVNLIWQDTATSEDGFQIERRGGSDGEFTQIAVVGANSTAYNDSTALANTVYQYRVRAFNATGVSDYSNSASVITPAAPSQLAVNTASLPEATTGVAYSQALSASGGTPPYTWLVESGTLPPGLSLSQSGTLAGIPEAAGTHNFVVRVSDEEGDIATRALSLVVKPTAPLTITTQELPRASVGNSYSQSLGASGGQTPYSWSLESGSLPEGLTLNQSGLISGTPERPGNASFVLKLTDATNTSVTATLSIIVNPSVVQLTITTTNLPDAVVGQTYDEELTAAGGNAPYRWTLVSGQLPAGITLSEDGALQGTPLATGKSSFEVQVADQSGQTVTERFELEVEPAPQFTVLTQSPLPPGAVGVPYRIEMKATAGVEPYKWVRKKKAKFGTLPPGISLAQNGVLSGTPGTEGTYNFTIHVRDASGRLVAKPFTMTVGPPPPPLEIRTTSLPSAPQNLQYRVQLEAAGGVVPYTWTIESGSLPDNMEMSPDGVISGRPSTLTAFTFTVKLTDAIGTVSMRTLSILVTPPPPPLVILTTQLPDASAERPYNQKLTASGGVAPYVWSIASGSLGTGLNLSADGTISGTPPSAATNVFVVRVTDAVGQSITRTLAILIRPADKLAPFGGLETPGARTTLNNIAMGSGWALDNVGVETIEVLIDGAKVGTAIYGLPRPDIAVTWGHFPNGSHSGFSFQIDTTKLTNGEHTLAVRVIDEAGNAAVMGTRIIQVQNAVLTIATTDLAKGKKGVPYHFQLLAANAWPPLTWTIASGSLPPGLSLNASGVISGLPTAFGTFQFAVRVTDSRGATAVASMTLIVLPDIEPLNILSRGELTAGQVAQPYVHQLLFSGGREPRTWALNSGALPPGLTLEATGGRIIGTPTQPGVFTFTVRLTDGTPTTVISDALMISIAPAPLEITSTGDLTPATVGVAYQHQLTFFGGLGAKQWALASSELPPGLTLNPTTGRISGTPTTAGEYTFFVTLTDDTGTATSGPLRIVVSAEPPPT